MRPRLVLPTLALFIVSLGYGVVILLVPAYASDAHVLALFYACYSASKIGAQVPGGVWVDRAGARRVLLVGLALFSLSLAGFLFDFGPAYIACVRLVEGAATGFVYVAVPSWVVARAPSGSAGKRIGAAIGIGSAGLLIGPAIAWKLSPYGQRVPVLVALGLSLAVGVACLALAPKTGAPAAPRSLRAEVGNLARMAATASFVGLLLPIFFNKLTFSAFPGLLPLYGPDVLHIGAGGVTGLLVLTGVCFGLAQAAGGYLADRIAPRRVVLAFTPALLAALCLQWLAGENPVGFTLAYAAYITCSSIIFTATLKHIAHVHGTQETYGGVFGVAGTLTDLATVLGPLVFLNLYGAAPRQVFLAMAGVGLPFAIGFTALTSSRSRTAPGAAP